MNRIFKYVNERASLFLYLFILFMSFLSMSFETGTGVRSVSEVVMNVTGFFQRLGSQSSVFVRGSINSISELSRLRNDYERLQEELEAYRVRAVSLEELERENNELRRLLGFQSTERDILIPARIIAKTPGSLSEEFVVDRGSVDGVQKDDPVITFGDGERILVGKVESVSLRTSLIIPIFSSSLYVASRLSVNRYEGLVSGQGEIQEELLMNYVPREARSNVGLGEKVVTSGLNSIYPAGITIGTVSSISAEPWETGIQLTINPTVRFSRLEYVHIVKTAESP